MRSAYIDTSYLAAIAFGESGATRLAKALQSFERVLSSNLLEAELRAALRRERAASDPDELLAGISWVYPDRPLTPEMIEILSLGYVRGADLWHLAVAMFVDPKRELAFLTLDERQHEVSIRLGFRSR